MARLYYGGYGHHPSGKQYAYWGGDNYRTKQNVVVPVKNKWSGRVYRTMFTIMRTSGEGKNLATQEANRLEAQGINIKSIEGRNVMSLPGARDFTSASQWKQESNERYLNDIRERLSGGRNNAVGNAIAKSRLLGAKL